MIKTVKHNRLFISSLFALIAVVYVLSLVIMPKKSFFICDAGCKFIQMNSIINSGYKDFSVQIPCRHIINSFKYVPTVHPFFGQYKDKVYGVFSFFFIIISSFFYKIFGFLGLYLFPFLSLFFILFAVWKLAGLFPAGKSIQPLAVLLTAFCTPLWFYSLTFWEILPATAMVIWSVYFFIKYLLNDRIKDLFFCAFFIAVSIYLRDEFYTLVLILMILIFMNNFRKWKICFLFGIMTGAILVPLWLFQWKLLGNPMGLHVTSLSLSELGFSGYIAERWKIVQRLLLNSYKNVPVSLMINIPFLLLLVIFPKILKRNYVVLVLSIIAVVSGLLFISNYVFADNKILAMGYSNGLFGVSPVLIYGLIRLRKNAFPSSTQSKIELIIWRVILMFIVSYLILCPYEHAKGLHWGCRYFLIVYPLVCLQAAWNFREFKFLKNASLFLKSSVIFVVLLSVANQVLSIYILYNRKKVIEELNNKVSMRPEKIVVVNRFYNAMGIGPFFYDKQIFLVTTSQKNALLKELRMRGIKRVLLVFYPDSKELIKGDVEILKNKYSLPVVIKKVKL